MSAPSGMVNSSSHYLRRFLDLPITELVCSRDSIEISLRDDLRETLAEILLKNDFHRSHNTYSNGECHVQMCEDFQLGIRTFRLIVRDLVKGVTAPMVEATLAEFGLIRTIVLEFPENLGIDPHEAVLRLRDQLAAASMALEQAFIGNSIHLKRMVFNNLYSCMEHRCRTSNKSHLIGRYWLFIAEEDVGFYYFDEKTIRMVVDYYKSHQESFHSPLELSCRIMTAPLPFQKSLAIESWRAGKALSLRWEKARYIAEATDIFEAEHALYESTEYTAYTLAEKRGFFLAFTCPTDIEKELLPEVEAIRDLLEIYFGEGLQYWSPYLKIIKEIPCAERGGAIVEFLGSVIGKGIAEFIKGLLRP
jgi:hypothetical protein